MTVLRIDHVNIGGSAELVDACRRFYVDVLGLHEGGRPPFLRRGWWLYAGDTPIVHLTEREHGVALQPPGPLDHFALQCSGLERMKAGLAAREIPFTIEEVPDRQQTQIFLTDPAGIALELNFDGRKE
jgi:catechol 2,3-dioxygenase-like lactoylglutathione lyase family enzyme